MKSPIPIFNSCWYSIDDPADIDMAFVVTNETNVAAIIHCDILFDSKFLSGSKIVSQNMAGPRVNKPELAAKKFSQGKADG